MSGLSSSLYGISRNRWLWAIVGICLIGIAAQVRPVVGSIPLVILCLGFSVLKSNGVPVRKSAVIKIAACACLIFVLALLPSVRNYYNHGMFRPTHLFSEAVFIMVQDVHRFDRENHLSDKALAGFCDIEKNEGIGARVKAMDQYSLDVIKKHPFLSAGFMTFNSLRNMFESHWQYTFFMFRSTWWQDDGYCVFKRTPQAVAFAVPWVLFYCSVYLAFLMFLYRNIRQHEWSLVLAAVFVLLPVAASSFCGQGARLRLPAEWYLILLGFAEILYRIDIVRRRVANKSSGIVSA